MASTKLMCIFYRHLSEKTRGLLKIQSMACLADHYRTDLCPCVLRCARVFVCETVSVWKIVIRSRSECESDEEGGEKLCSEN